MKLTSFLITFSSVYIPLTISLLLIHVGVQTLTQLPSKMFKQEPQITKQIDPKFKIQAHPQPKIVPQNPSSSDQEEEKPQQPQFYYFVELTSGGSMNAKAIASKGDQVTLYVDDGYKITLPKKDIKAVHKVAL